MFKFNLYQFNLQHNTTTALANQNCADTFLVENFRWK